MTLREYVQGFVRENRVRWTYVRSKESKKIGVLISYWGVLNGEKTLFVGLSKVNDKHRIIKGKVKLGDTFELNMGISKAIKNAMPYDEFCARYTLGQLPTLPAGKRAVRDENKKVVMRIDDQGREVMELEEFCQYHSFMSGVERHYKLNEPQAIIA